MKALFEKKEEFRLKAVFADGFQGFAPMFHPHCELIYVVEGSIPMIIDGHETELQAGEISLTFPFAIHQYQDAPAARAMIFLFSPEQAGIFASRLHSLSPALPYTTPLFELKPLLERILALYQTWDPQKEQLAEAYLSAAVGEVLSRMKLIPKEERQDDSTKLVLTYCADHFKEEVLSLRSVAEALFLSESYVTKIFHRKLKTGFRDYVNALRISHAKKLLETTQLKILEVMLECGFSNQSSFNRVFFRHCSMTPKDYRSRQKSKG